LSVLRYTSLSAPPSQGQTVRNVTTYSYWDNGWVKSSTDPWDIATSYDYNALGQQTARTVTSAGGSSARTMGWEYHPDGALKTRSDDGVPVGRAVALVDNSDTQNVTVTGSWATTSAGSGFQGYDYRTHAAGTGTSSVAWRTVVPQDGDYDVYVRYPTVSGAATNASYTVEHAGGSVTKPVSQAAGGGSWVSLGRYGFTRGSTTQKVTLSDAANGAVAADAVKLVRDNAADVDTERKTFSYGYDPNGNLVSLADGSPGAAVDTYAVGYDGLDRVTTVEEKAGPTVKHTTSFSYDANGNPLTRGHDGKQATYTYDPRDLLASVTNAESATDPSPKLTRYTYTDRGQVLRQTKANGNTVEHTYWADALLHTQVEKKSNGTLVASHELAYSANGHRITDVAKVQNADNSAAYLDTTTTYTYDPGDRIAQVTKTPTGGTAAVESYVHDANDNVVSQTVKGVATTFGYDRNRLLSATTAGITSAYNYDPFGRLDTVFTAGTLTARYSYDGFDRIGERFVTGAAGTTRYAYDPLDRTVSRTEKAGTAGEKTTSFAYLGLSDQVVAEQVGGRTTKTYQYALGRRVSQTTVAADGTKTNGFFGYNPHTDVETVTDSAGNTRSTYAYTAYGADDPSLFTGADKPGAVAPDGEPASAFRFNGRRLDPGSGEYDMGFRDYAPGLNRFLTRDSYDGALADLRMAADPFTGNRYAFASGNPISRIELDGHCWGPDLVCDVAGGVVDTVTAPVTGLISTITGAGAAIACPSAVGYATAGTACNGVQESVTTSVQNQYNDLLDLGGVHGSIGWRAGQVIGVVGIPGAGATRAAAAARAAARRAATQAADKVAAQASSRLLDDAVRIEAHLGRLDYSPANDAMLARIRSAAAEGRPLSEADRNFMTHELTEADLMGRGMAYDEAHEIAGRTHPTFANYDPEVIKQFPELFNQNWRNYWGIG
jgi:RHS repeat-associated protein